MKNILRFISYHNAIPIGLGVIFLGSGAALAASPDVRDTFISSETTIRSVDNSYLLSADFDAFSPGLRITDVTEDTSFYYVSYSYTEVGIDDYVWKPLARVKTLSVSKVSLQGRDLGLFVAQELGEVTDMTVRYAKEAQGIEREKGRSVKIATVAYAGLIGQFLEPNEMVFEGYTPVIPEVPLVVGESSTTSAATADTVIADVGLPSVSLGVADREEIRRIVAETVQSILASQPQPAAVIESQNETATEEESVGTEQPAPSDTVAPVITVLGNNPADIAVGASYSDLGATVTDNVNDSLGYSIAVNGAPVTEVSLGTSEVRTYTITYTATDQAGNSTTATRTVNVAAPASPEEPAETATTTSNDSESTDSTE